jgi:hypothetical protein
MNRLKALKALWSSLPHPVQAILVAFGTAAATAFLHAFSEANCYSSACLGHYALTSLAAGAAAARAFYMVPNRTLPPAPPAAE